MMQNTLDKCRSHSEMYFGEDPSPLAPAASLSGAVVILWLATEVAVMCWWSIKPMASIELTAAAAAAAAKATEVWGKMSEVAAVEAEVGEIEQDEGEGPAEMIMLLLLLLCIDWVWPETVAARPSMSRTDGSGGMVWGWCCWDCCSGWSEVMEARDVRSLR